MILLANQSHPQWLSACLVYFSPISTFHILVIIWYVCAGFNFNIHFFACYYYVIFCFLSKVSFGLVPQWVDPKRLVLEFRKVTKGRRGWGVCVGGMGCNGCGNSLNIQSHLKNRLFCNWPHNSIFELQWPLATHCISMSWVLLDKLHELQKLQLIIYMV
jgi:hypothetical protein